MVNQNTIPSGMVVIKCCRAMQDAEHVHEIGIWWSDLANLWISGHIAIANVSIPCIF